MVSCRSIALSIVFLGVVMSTAPLQAQTSAVLSISARVVEECTVKSKRELVKLARRLKDPDLIRRCSKGVVSRVDQRVVKIGKIRPPSVQPRRVGQKRVVRKTVGGKTDVVLVTVTY